LALRWTPPFFPRRLDPVLDGGEGDEDAVVTPQVPGSQAVGQAVFDHEAHRQGADAVGVMAAAGREVGEVGAKVQAAGLAAVLGVDDVEVSGAVAPPADEFREDAAAAAVAIATTAALRAGAAAVTT
jgi:hypothetical protein